MPIGQKVPRHTKLSTLSRTQAKNRHGRPPWGFVTCFKDPGTSVKGIKDVFLNGDSPLFRFGGSFGGWVYGVAAHGGSPDASGKVGPDVVANYSDFAGVFGTGVYVEGVAGTSVLHCGVYGQTGEIPTRDAPQ